MATDTLNISLPVLWIYNHEVWHLPYIVTVTGNMCCLQSLGLGGNEIHNEGVTHLALALQANRRLRSLGLGGNQIGS